MKTIVSILAMCVAAGCAHGKAGSESAHRGERGEKSAHVTGRGKAPGEAPVAQRMPESPSDAEGDRVDVPSARRREELASTGNELPGQQPAPAAGPPPASEAGADAKNTRVNERDRDDQALTPMDQGGGTSDREITQRIRKAVVADDALSFTAKNVKIITRDGKVTLRGPVNSAQERTSIERAAQTVAGPNQVVNQLEVSN